MPDLMYLTADRIGTPTGGGIVTHNELEALKTLGDTLLVSREQLEETDRLHCQFKPEGEPWKWDNYAYYKFGSGIKLAHIYAGTFGDCVDKLKSCKAKVTYTAAAHSIEESQKEHEKLGLEYNYPHLTEPSLLKRYLSGYLRADIVITPSTHSRDVMLGFGVSPEKIRIIPHGCNVEDVSRTPFAYPKRFTVGYLGAIGPDKGVIYLLQAWKKLNYKDAVLMIGGRDSTTPFMKYLINTYGGGGILLAGWVNKASDFYNQISCLVQASCSEGFGLEVLEAMAHGRPAICSRGAGACDLVSEQDRFAPRDVDELISKIEFYKKSHDNPNVTWDVTCYSLIEEAAKYTWDKIREKYIEVWKELL